MTAERWFFDTNVLVYLFDAKAPEKQRLAQDLFRSAVGEAQPVVSTQVLQEFFVTVTRTTKRGLPVNEARQLLRLDTDLLVYILKQRPHIERRLCAL